MAREIATILLDAKAVALRPKEPFTYASGLQGPVYCDNRLLLSLPSEREQVLTAFEKLIEPLEFDIIAGTATAGIPWAAWLAAATNKPLIYIRGKAKGHGKQNQIEGTLEKENHVLVVEDLINTGGSSIDAVNAVRNAGGVVTDCIAITTHGVKKSVQRFAEATCTLHTLTTLSELLDEATALSEEEKQLIRTWQKNPEDWQ